MIGYACLLDIGYYRTVAASMLPVSKWTQSFSEPCLPRISSRLLEVKYCILIETSHSTFKRCHARCGGAAKVEAPKSKSLVATADSWYINQDARTNNMYPKSSFVSYFTSCRAGSELRYRVAKRNPTRKREGN